MWNRDATQASLYEAEIERLKQEAAEAFERGRADGARNLMLAATASLEAVKDPITHAARMEAECARLRKQLKDLREALRLAPCDCLFPYKDAPKLICRRCYMLARTEET